MGLGLGLGLGLEQVLGQPSRLVLELALRPCHLRRVEERREREPAQAGELRRERRLCEALAAACVQKMAGVAAQVSHAELDGRWGHHLTRCSSMGPSGGRRRRRP